MSKLLRMVVVDDEQWVRQLVTSIIDWKGAGFSLIGEATDGEEALSIIRSKPVDVVITDVRMPIVDGLELIRTVRQEQVEVEFIILSGYDDFRYAQAAIGYDVSEYILKPVDAEQIMSAARRVRSKIMDRLKSANQIRTLKTSIRKLERVGTDTDEAPPPVDLSREDRVSRVERYVQEKYSEPISLTSAAEHVFCSSAYLSTVFKRVTGIGFSDYVTQVRLDRAAGLLKTGVFKVNEAALMVGFSDSNYFCRVFRRHFGMSPGDYVKRSK